MEAQRRASDAHKVVETPVQAGDPEALKGYVDSWKKQLGSHGAARLRAKEAAAGGQPTTTERDTATAEAAIESDQQAASEAARVVAPPVEHGSAAAVQALAGVVEPKPKLGDRPKFAPPARSGASVAHEPGLGPLRESSAADVAASHVSPTASASSSAARGRRATGDWGVSASDFRVATASVGDGCSETFADRQFAVLGDADPYAGLLSSGDTQGASAGASRSGRSAGFAGSCARGGGEPAKDAVMPQIWERLAPATRDAELRALEANFSHVDSDAGDSRARCCTVQSKNELQVLD